MVRIGVLWVATGVFVLASLRPLLILFTASGKGFDLSDEGMYLVSASSPRPSLPLEGTWGNVIHYLFALCGYNVVAYRVLSVSILFLIAAGFGLALASSSLFDRSALQSRSERAAVVVAAGALSGVLSLYFYSLLLLTPGYNWLNFCGIYCFLLGGVLVADPRFARSSRWWLRLGYVLLVLGMGFVASSRIATFAVLFCIGVLCAVVAVSKMWSTHRRFSLGKRWWEFPAIAGAEIVAYCVLVCGPLAFWAGLKREKTYTNLEGTYSLSVLTRQTFQDLSITYRAAFDLARPSIVLLIALWLLGAAILGMKRSWRHSPFVASSFESISLVLVMGFALWLKHTGHLAGGPLSYSLDPLSADAVLIVALCAAFLEFFAALVAKEHGSQRHVVVQAFLRKLFVVALLVLVSYAFGYSSANGTLVESTLSSGLLWLAAFVLLFPRVLAGFFRPLALCGLALAFVLCVSQVVVASSQEPYRSSVVSATARGTLTQLGNSGGGKVLLSSQDAAFVSGLVRAAARAGFTSGTPLEDFTPFNPGIGYLLGALSPPTAILAVHNSRTLFRWSLNLQPTSFRRQAWLVLANSGPTLAESAALLGVRPQDDYVKVFSGYWAPEGQTFSLYRPKRQ